MEDEIIECPHLTDDYEFDGEGNCYCPRCEEIELLKDENI